MPPASGCLGVWIPVARCGKGAQEGVGCVRRGAVGWTWLALLVVAFCRTGICQSQAPSEKLLITGKSAAIWSAKGTQVIQLEGPVTVTLDRATLSAKQAVIWLS